MIPSCRKCGGPRIRVVCAGKPRNICRSCKAYDQRKFYARHTQQIIQEQTDYQRRKAKLDRTGLCVCGCGTLINKRSRYARGHNNNFLRQTSLVCWRCRNDHGGNLEMFCPDKRLSLGRKNLCFGCQKELNREAIQRNTAIIKAFKDRPCADCGQRFPRFVMDCDHREGTTKTLEISKGLLVSEARLRTEMDKCDVVCANCHRIRTHRRSGWQE